MRPLKLQANPIHASPVILTGGLNEQVAAIELKPGELLTGINYLEIDGDYHGYSSIEGYEVFDGTVLASAIDGNAEDDTARETRRSEILPIPTTLGSAPVTGVHIYKGDVYGCRDYDVSNARMYRSTAAGWVHVPDPVTAPMNLDGSSSWVNGTFSTFPLSQNGGYIPSVTNTSILVHVDGVSKPRAFDGTTSYDLSTADLPCDDASTDIRYPNEVAFFDNRLWLAFPGGHLFYSAIGAPNDWSSVSGAGYFPTGGEITNIVQAPGNVLVIHMEDSIKILSVAENPTADYIYRMSDFSPRSGGLRGTVVRMLGKVHYMDDRGLTSMTSTSAFGDFNAKSMSKKVHRTVTRNINKFNVAIPNRIMNQYRVFFGEYGLCFTFDTRKQVKGATIFAYDHQVLCATEGPNDEHGVDMYFGSDDGFVYKMDSGTSFNGNSITTFLSTSYSHYGSPTTNKMFYKLLFEITTSHEVEFLIATDFDYGKEDSPTNPYETVDELEAVGGVWGSATWGSFVWGGSAVVQNPSVYIEGTGVNMSVKIRTSEKYSTSHSIHNFIAKYSNLAQIM